MSIFNAWNKPTASGINTPWVDDSIAALTATEIRRRQLQQAQDRVQQMAQIPPHVYGNTLNIPSKPDVPAALMAMVASRMRWPSPGTAPWPFFACHKLDENVVVVFVVAGGNEISIRDDYALFPSDALITQLRLLPVEQK